MSADQFPIENGLAAQALTAATTAPIADEAWADGDALLYSVTDGKLHPVPVQPLAGAIVSVSGVAPIGVSPGVAPIVSLSGVVGVDYGGTGSATGDASSLTNIPAAQLAGDVALARLATALAVGGDPIKGTVLTATTRVDAPSVGASSTAQHALPAGTGDLVSADASQVLTNKTISGSDNTLSNIGNASLTNSSITVTASTGLSGGGSVALGGSTSLSLPSVGTAGTYAYPSSMTTDAQGRVSSVTAGSAPTIGGSAVMLAQVSSNGGAGWIFAGDYFGLSQMIESGRGTATNVAPWVAPCAGTLKNFRTWTVAAAPSNSAFTVYQAATSSTPTYNATAAVINIASGAHLGADTTHTLTIAAGDLIIFKTDTSWTNPGFCIQAQFIPSTS